MNSILIRGYWYEQIGMLKQKYAVLTNNILMLEEGRVEEFYGKLQIKLGKTKGLKQKALKVL